MDKSPLLTYETFLINLLLYSANVKERSRIGPHSLTPTTIKLDKGTLQQVDVTDCRGTTTSLLFVHLDSGYISSNSKLITKDKFAPITQDEFTTIMNHAIYGIAPDAQD